MKSTLALLSLGVLLSTTACATTEAGDIGGDQGDDSGDLSSTAATDDDNVSVETSDLDSVVARRCDGDNRGG